MPDQQTYFWDIKTHAPACNDEHVHWHNVLWRANIRAVKVYGQRGDCYPTGFAAEYENAAWAWECWSSWRMQAAEMLERNRPPKRWSYLW